MAHRSDLPLQEMLIGAVWAEGAATKTLAVLQNAVF